MPYLRTETLCPEPIDCKILTAALSLFVQKGYYNVSIHEIQEVSDVSIGSIYRHFGGKAGIAKALYQHLLNEVDELIDSVTKKTNSPIEQIEEIIKQFFEFTETHPEIISFIFHTKHTEFLPDEPLLYESKPFVKLINIATKTTKKFELKTIDSPVAYSIIFGSMIKIIQLRLDGLLDTSPINYLDVIMRNNIGWNEGKTPIPLIEPHYI